MEELKRLVRLVVKHNSKVSPLVNQLDTESLETKFFNLIKNNEVTTDEEAAEALYGDKVLSATYRMLKSRIRKKLFGHLHFFEFDDKTSRHSGIVDYKCESLLLEAKCMILANEFKIADKILDQVISLADSHELVSVMVKALEQKQLVNMNLLNRNAYITLEKKLAKYYAIEENVRTSTNLFRTTHLFLSTSVNNRKEHLLQVPDTLKTIYTLWEKTSSSSIFNYYHILNIHYLELQGDYHSIAHAVEKAEELLENGKLHPSWFNNRYNYFIQVYALLRTKQYERGLALAENYLAKFDLVSFNRFAFMENYLLLAIHSKRYSLAGELLLQNLNNPLIGKLHQQAKERWELYRRYLLLLTDVLPVQLQVELPQDIFIELVSLPKDKAGFNLSLLVLDIIQSFQSRHFDDYEQQAERIRKYILKYMRGEKAERPRLFLRLLLLAIKHELDFTRTSEASQNLYAKLRQASPPGDAFAEVEIVPYEHLWETVLLVLRSRER